MKKQFYYSLLLAALMGQALLTAHALEPDDEQFLTQAAQGGRLAAQLGELTGKQAANPAVKAFGERMVKDHSEVNRKLKDLAQAKQFQLPTALPEREQKMASHMETMSGRKFDESYIARMLDDHKRDIEQFERAAESGKDADIRKFALEALPALREHLAVARNVERQL